MTEKINEPRVIQSVQRAFDIIDCFSRQQPELSLSEISQIVKLNKSTIHGLLQTMLYNGYISQDAQTDKYKLGKKFISKTLLIPESSVIQQVSEKYLKRISERHGVTSHLMIEEHDVLYTMKVIFPSNTYYIISAILGKKVPFHATASGKIMMSAMTEERLLNCIRLNPLVSYTPKTIVDIGVLQEELQKIRENGYALEDEEVESGVFSIACPIHNQYHQIFGTISISASLLKEPDQAALILELQDASREISAEFQKS